jgi:hypothetical protein
MDWKKFQRCMDVFNTYQVRPLLGIIPDNTDPSLMYNSVSGEFWPMIRNLISSNRIDVALHGYHHQYETDQRGILGSHYGFKKGSEFAGLPFDVQFEKISKAAEILKRERILPEIFMAPNHSFDFATLKVLLSLGFKAITDGIGLYPYLQSGILFIPQIFWRLRKMPFGIITFCLHPNTMSDSDFFQLETFCKAEKNIFAFHDIYEFKPNMLHYFINMLYRIIYIITRYIRNKFTSWTKRK